jgi:multiple antibiotic resistance protein
MTAFFDVKFFWEVFVTLTVITDPVGNVPLFIALTRGMAPRVRHRHAWQAALVALGVIVVFALFGQSILTYLGVQLAALQAAGGLLLLLVALQLLGASAEPAENEQANLAFVPLGTPLLAGPGAIVATMVFVQRIGGGAQIAAFAVALALVTVALWLSMRFCGVILKVLRPSGVELVTRISGLLVSAIAVQLVATAALAFANGSAGR